MPFPTLPSSPAPDWGYTVNRQPKLLEAAFGDGYVQRMPEGINSNAEGTIQLRWTNITEAEMEIIYDFLSSRAGYLPFEYTIPDETVAKQWVCKQWSKTGSDYNNFGVEAELTRDFTP